jgi:uncharacterized protein YjiS (DUF1127 family)
MEVTMTKHSMMQRTSGRTTLRVPGSFPGYPLESLQTIVCEWRTRRNIERSLGYLSNFHLRDVGLTRADVEAACADSFDRSASRALKSAAQNRVGNW